MVQGNQILMRNRLSIAMSTATTSTKKLPFNQMVLQRLWKTGDWILKRPLKRLRLTILRSLKRKLLTTQVEKEVLRCPTNVLSAVKDSVHLGVSQGISDASTGPRKNVVIVTR